ncbi:MAG TPA: molybdopterin-dependent oxidoreductase [Actinomycetota bacterium]|nr:molybdopterin-dependent oxidoreductase [Actinomycetota bacterium]
MIEDGELTEEVLAGRRRSSARLAGACAATVALSILWVASTLAGGIPFAPAAIAEALIRVTPGDIATFFIELLQHWALRLLSIAVVVGAVAVGGEVLYRTMKNRRVRPGAAGLLLGIAALLGSVLGPGERVEPLPLLLATTVAAFSYARVSAPLYYGLVAQGPETDSGRRRALRVGLGGAVGVAAAGGVIGWFAGRLAGPNTDVALAAPVRAAEVPDRAPFPDVPGLPSEITSAEDHYVVDINLIQPSVEAENWKLRVFGRVDSPLELTFEQLQSRFDVVEEFSVLTCVSNEVGGELIGNSAWGGVRLRDLLEAAGAEDDAVDVVFRAADGYSDSIPMDRAREPAALVAISQNGRPLTQAHGFPCRVRVPAIYGMKNVKWLESIEVVGSDYEGYWQRRGWSDVAEVRTQSRIAVAGDDGSARRGTATWIAGVAWAGDRGIDKVEVSVDAEQTWQDALLKEPLAPNAWRLWAYRWTPEHTGKVLVSCRATDGRGTTQTRDLAEPHPAGATGYHRVEVVVA